MFRKAPLLLRQAVSCSMLFAGIFVSSLQAQTVELRSGVLADAASATVFVMHPEGGIDAVNTADGSLRWHSDSGQRPVLQEQGRLLTQGNAGQQDNELNLVVLDAASGVAVASQFVDLPQGVVASINDGLGTSFSVSSLGSGFVSWQSQRQLIQGAFQENQQPAVNRDNGGLSVDVQAGIVAPVSFDDLPPAQPRIINAQPGELLQGVAGRQFVSADRNHRLASRRTKSDSFMVYQWDIYNAGGAVLGSIAAHTSRSDFIVLDDAVMLYVSDPFAVREGNQLVEYPLSLIAVDLTSGEVLWRLPLRDTSYRGPYPA